MPRLSSIPCDKIEEDGSNDGDLDVYEPQVCYDKNDGIYAEVVIFVNKRLVRLMDVIVAQCYKKQFDEYTEIKKQWVTRGIDADMEYDPSVVAFAEWLASKFYNHKTLDRISDPDDENLIDKDEVDKIFRIETNILDFETPICKVFDEFNYLLKIDIDLLTSDILRFKTYIEFKNEWMGDWNKIPWVPEEPWSGDGILIDDIRHIYKPIRFKNGKAKWPTCNLNDEGFYNGGELSGMVRVGYMTYFQDYEWMNDHECSPFSNWRNHRNGAYANTNIDANYNPYLDVFRTFNNHEGRNDEKDIHEEIESNDDHGIGNLDNDLVWDNASYHANDEEYEEDRCEFLGNPCQKPLVCVIRRFENIKYSFGPAEKYISIKECEYDNLTKTKDYACHAYQEIYYIMDEGWFVTRVE
nr:VIER F-box protein 2 [Tanacetum cinerariifolium]